MAGVFDAMTPRQKQTLDLIRANPGGISRSAIGLELGISEITAGRHCNDLREQGLAMSTNRGGDSVWVAVPFAYPRPVSSVWDLASPSIMGGLDG